MNTQKIYLKSQNAFTLVELMIVVAIVGILASIAIPSYQESVRKSRRSDATGALMVLSNKMERYFTENSTYVGAAAVAGDSTEHYTLTVPAGTLTATSYVLSAAPIGTDSCGTLTLSSTGVKTPSTAGCW